MKTVRCKQIHTSTDLQTHTHTHTHSHSHTLTHGPDTIILAVSSHLQVLPKEHAVNQKNRVSSGESKTRTPITPAPHLTPSPSPFGTFSLRLTFS